MLGLDHMEVRELIAGWAEWNLEGATRDEHLRAMLRPVGEHGQMPEQSCARALPAQWWQTEHGRATANALGIVLVVEDVYSGIRLAFHPDDPDGSRGPVVGLSFNGSDHWDIEIYDTSKFLPPFEDELGQ